MPRIEIIPDNWHNSPQCGAGDGTPIVDVCHICMRRFVEGMEAPASLTEYPRAIVGSTDVQHPRYHPEYRCEVCGMPLSDKDN